MSRSGFAQSMAKVYRDGDIEPVKGLALAVVEKAVKDYFGRDLVERAFAFLWFCSEDFGLFADALGVGDIWSRLDKGVQK